MNIIKSAIFTIVAAAVAFGQDQTPRAEFEVASVKKSATPEPGQYNMGLHIDGAMVNCTYLSLKSYISMAYEVPDTRISGPDWLDSEKFDIDRKSTRLNSSHLGISYAVFCLKKKTAGAKRSAPATDSHFPFRRAASILSFALAESQRFFFL